MINIPYTPTVSYSFTDYNDCDAGWCMSAERTTKQFIHDYVKPDFTIIDAGANIGMYTVPFSKLASSGKVYAFEPTDIMDKLKSNLTHNGCLDNVVLCNQPLGEHDEVKFDRIFKVWSQGIVDDKDHNFITLDTFVKNNDLKVDLIKIDVDSYDYEVLLGGKNFLTTQSPLIIIELNYALEKRGHTVEEAVDFLTSLDYKLLHIFDNENYIFSK